MVSGTIRYSIPEELQLGAFVGNLALDLGLDIKQLSTRGSRIVAGSKKIYMDINLDNGILFVKEKIDREQLCESSLFCVLSFDVLFENPLKLYTVSVEILDVNDNAPIFPESQIGLEIPELAAPGARFLLESAQDADVGTNSLQTYKLQPNEYFFLDVQTRSGSEMLPVLVLQRPLDREKQPVHKLVLVAEDGGLPLRSGTVQVTITVNDANDNVPIFPQSVYRVSLLESAPKGTLIIKLNATDPDDGPNGEIMYSFSSHNSARVRKLFDVNSKNGEIRLKGNLDYEESSTVQMNVQAIDMGLNAMAVHCDVLLDIIDANDNAPEVTLTSQSSKVLEDAPNGTVVALFNVEDKDSGQNGQVRCQISNKLPFRLDSTLRNYYELHIDQPLDRENTSSYDVTITCTDSGIRPLSSHATVRVDVTDVNDNAPRFLHPSYTAHVMENNVIGASILRLNAIDPDAGHNARLKFYFLEPALQDTQASSYVSINSTSGVVFAERSFDYEQLKHFRVQVQVQDFGVPPLTSNVAVDVVILDQNDNAPVIVSPLPEYGSTIMETISRFAEPGYLVLRLSAIDADNGQNALLSFQIYQATHHDLFTISPETGEIWTTRRIMSRDASKQTLVIVVKDSGSPPLSASVTIVLTVEGSHSQTFSSINSATKNTGFTLDLSFSLVIILGITSSVFFVILVILGFIVQRNRQGLGGQRRSLGACCCFGAAASLNGIEKASRSLQLPPNYVEVFGGDPLSQRFRYESCSTLQSTNAKACGQPADNHYVQREFFGKGKREKGNLDNCSSTVNNEVKQPNADWHFSQAHRAELNSSQYLEEEGARREIQCEVQREVQRDVQREPLRDEPCEAPRNIQRDVPRDSHCDGQRAAENDPGGPRKPMCARPPAIPAGRDGWTLPRTAPRMQLQMTLGAHVPGTLRSQYLFPRDPLTPGARISNSSVEFSAFPVGSHHGPWAANQTRDRGSVTDSGTRRPELDTETGGEIHRSPPSVRLPTQRLHSRDHHHALRQIND
ncbi:protocadherin beta-8-like isoform X12 [Leucoraja erinacea]|uniref:protocadherin beta-8-like isoform X12 n=1 Tax=Leucoraja erinaceus TaxID=7782 RepID=UPI002457B973|nr:protocadherin beta-8-like isoform X12 [Leucoraja erinacea]